MRAHTDTFSLLSLLSLLLFLVLSPTAFPTQPLTHMMFATLHFHFPLAIAPAHDTTVRTGSKQSMFKVHPRYKIRAEGEAVRAGDAILLKSVDANGQHLAFTEVAFTAENRVGKEGLHQIGDREASCSAEPQAWQVEILSRAAPPVQSTSSQPRRGGSGSGSGSGSASFAAVAVAETLHIGDVVYFEHRELEMHLGVNPDARKVRCFFIMPHFFLLTRMVPLDLMWCCRSLVNLHVLQSHTF
jgi:hypothetical protein